MIRILTNWILTGVNQIKYNTKTWLSIDKMIKSILESARDGRAGNSHT